MDITITDPLMKRDDLRKINPNFGNFEFPEELVILADYMSWLNVCHARHQFETGERYSFGIIRRSLAESLELDLEELENLQDRGLWIAHDRQLMAMSEEDRLAYYAEVPSLEDIAYIQEQGMDLETMLKEVKELQEKRDNEVAFLNELFTNNDSGLDKS